MLQGMILRRERGGLWIPIELNGGGKAGDVSLQRGSRIGGRRGTGLPYIWRRWDIASSILSSTVWPHRSSIALESTEF